MVGKRIMAADVSRGHPGLIRASLRDRWSSCLQWIEMQHPDGFFLMQETSIPHLQMLIISDDVYPIIP
jgi:hypothetical protein